MLYLLQLEWKKWRKNLTFRLISLAYFIILPSVLLLGKKLPDLPPPIGTNEIFFIFPSIWIYLSYIGHQLAFFLFGFLTILMITTEYSNRTFRQNIIDGLSRREYFWGKVAMIGSIAFFATIYLILCGLVIGYFNTDLIRFQKVFQHADYFYRFFLLCFAYMTFAMLVAILIKRTIIVLFFYFGAVIGELILRWGVHQNLWNHKSMHFYPLNAIEDLIPVPFSEVADRFLEQNQFDFFLSPTEAILTTVVYTTLFLLLIYRYLQKASL